MPSYQYHLVVLARRPRTYGYLTSLTAVRPPGDAIGPAGAGADYRVAILQPSRRILLPMVAERWTSISHILWDDLPPTSLTPAQQRAMLDWLHFGGRLIVSGPGSLDSLRGSFLEPLMPARSTGTRPLATDDLTVLRRWRRAAEPQTLAVSKPISAVGLELSDPVRCRFIPGLGRLFAECRVGRGRVIVSALPLNDRRLANWPGWDDVVNACLLGRPPRRFVVGELGKTVAQWADRHRWPIYHDARLNSGLRYFARDAGVAFEDYATDMVHDQQLLAQTQAPVVGFVPDWDAPEDLVDPLAEPSAGGVAAWRDSAAVPDAAREALRQAAGVDVPPPRFVAWTVVGYMVVLVPVNWLVFRVLGRLEWAWLAAPLVALGCAAVVVHVARLNLGFVRSRSEVAVIELQAGSASAASAYPRAHVTRYMAMFSSLATHYEFTFDQPGGAVLPMAMESADAAARRVDRRPRSDAAARPLRLTPGARPTIGGFSVTSSATGMVHAEQVLDLGGSLSLIRDPDGRMSVVNGTPLELIGVGVIAKQSDIHATCAWIGQLPPGARCRLSVERRSVSTIRDDFWRAERREDLDHHAADPRTALLLPRLCALAQSPADMEVGETRLVGLTETPLGGLTIDPAAAQRHTAGLVVAHLEFGFPGEPESDVNSPDEVKQQP
jgi:hypothetical protein